MPNLQGSQIILFSGGPIVGRHYLNILPILEPKISKAIPVRTGGFDIFKFISSSTFVFRIQLQVWHELKLIDKQPDED